MMSTVNPAFSAVAAVIGPIHAVLAWPTALKSPSIAFNRLVTVEELAGHLDDPNWADVQLFSVGDYIRLLHIDTSGGGLVVADVWGTVSAYSNLTGGEQSWTFTCTDDGGVNGQTIFAGAIALGYGASGDGVWEATVTDTSGAPYSQVTTWTSDPSVPANFTTHTRLGELTGLGITGEYGLWAGEGTGNTDGQIIATDGQLTLKNIDLTIHNGSENVFEINRTTPYMAMGESIPSYQESGFWVGLHSGTYKLSLGGGLGNPQLLWDGTNVIIASTATTYLYLTGSQIRMYADAVETFNLDGVSGDVRFGEVGIGKANLFFDASAGALLLRVNTTNYIQMQSDGDVVLGLTSSGQSNLFYDTSAGTLNLRNATTVYAQLASNGDLRLGLSTSGNLFYDASDQYGLSQTAKYFIGGVLKHLKAICAFTASTVNSYKRLVPHHWASAYVCYGLDNREAAVRVVAGNKGQEASSFNIELKPVDPACNPYLAVLATLAAGMDGIANHIDPGQPVLQDPHELPEQERQTRGITRLPRTLAEATDALAADLFFKDLLGEVFWDEYIQLKRFAWNRYIEHVSDWEIQTYAEIF